MSVGQGFQFRIRTWVKPGIAVATGKLGQRAVESRVSDAAECLGSEAVESLGKFSLAPDMSEAS